MPLAFRNTPFRKSVLSSVDNTSNMLNMQPYDRPIILLCWNQDSVCVDKRFGKIKKNFQDIFVCDLFFTSETGELFSLDQILFQIYRGKTHFLWNFGCSTQIFKAT